MAMLPPPTLSPTRPALALGPDLAVLVAAHLSAPADHAAFALVSRACRAPAQRALFHALRLHEPARTRGACRFLADHPRLGTYVDALALFVGDADEPDSDSDSDSGSDSDESMASAPPEPPPLPADFWPAVRDGLAALPRLRFLTLYISTPSLEPPALSSLCTPHPLSATTFSLLSFHADLAWDGDLARFLSAQPRLGDLFLADWRRPDAHGEHQVCKDALTALHVLECPTPAAAAALVPARPVRYVKTEFPTPCDPGLPRIPDDTDDATLSTLLAALPRASAPLRSLALAHAPLSLADRLLAVPAPYLALRFVGTLALPVAPAPRLRTYAALRALPVLRAAALDVAGWALPVCGRAQAAALAKEAALYAHGLRAVVLEGVGRTGSVVVRRRPEGAVWWMERAVESVWREV